MTETAEAADTTTPTKTMDTIGNGAVDLGAAVHEDLLVVFEYAYQHDDWVNPLSEALAGVTPEEALWKPGVSGKGIWEIVLHMANWNENMVARMQGDPYARPAEGPWPALPEVRDDTTWAQSQQRLWDSLTALRAQIAATSSADLLARREKWGSLLDDVLCRYIHIGYHIGQITKIREFRS